MALPALALAHWPPDPLASPEYYRGVTLRRILAYFIDVVILTAILISLHAALALVTIATLGLLWPLHLLVVPIAVAAAYHTLLIGSPSGATLGMRACNIRVHGILGGPPSLLQAFIQTVCFYTTVSFSGGILLIIALFNPRRRTLHDVLAGTIVLRNIK